MNEKEKQELIDKLLKLAKNEIRITYSKSNAPLSATASKIGGAPAVPEGFEWPYYIGKTFDEDEPQSRPLAFLAQINLKDVLGLDKENLLPKSGILSFFYELETMTWGFDPKDKGSAKVFYFPDDLELEAAEMPEELEELEYSVIPEFALNFEQHISIPGFESIEDDVDWDDFDECSSECGYEHDEWGDYTKLLGYPDVIQNPMEEECETVTRGYYQGGPDDSKKITPEEKEDIKKKSEEWMLLFQMGTVTDEDNDYELMFGDCGHIYFWIRKSDLKNRDFDNIWLVLQCG